MQITPYNTKWGKNMVIDISKIVSEKLEQMENDGVIRQAIEENLEKTIIGAVSSALSSYHFRNQIEKQIDDAIGGIAGNCGLSAYNSFIAENAAAIVQNMYNNDISKKVQRALEDTLVHDYSGIKLSEIFDKYREWVKENTDTDDQYKYEQFTCSLEQHESGSFQHLTCKFADHPLSETVYEKERGEIEIRFCRYKNEEKVRISTLWLNDHDLKNSIRIGTLSSFEAFISNLYYNETEVEMDVENVDEDNYYGIDC